MMDRRAFLSSLGFVTLAGPLAAKAQQAGKVYRIMFLGASSPALESGPMAAFRQGLRDLGYPTDTWRITQVGLPHAAPS
jgi:putative tryptophan/tyrosine transport system substrate-binding protein